MFNSTVLDVAIGMVFIYLLLSLICSAVNEIIEAWLKKRSTDLERGIRELLDDKDGTGLVQKLYKHHLVSGLYRGLYDATKIDAKSGRYQIRGLLTNKDAADLPSYIPARNFALALMDVLMPADANTRSGAAMATATAPPPAAVPPPAAPGVASPPLSALPADPLKDLRDAITGNADLSQELKGALLSLVDAAGNDVSKARQNIEKWFDSSMDRVSGWYKRRVQVITIFIGLGLTVFANADTIAISKSLANDPSLRQSLVAAAQEYAKANPTPTPTTTSTTTTTTPSSSSSGTDSGSSAESSPPALTSIEDLCKDEESPACLACRKDPDSSACKTCQKDPDSLVCAACQRDPNSPECEDCRRDEKSPECRVARNLGQLQRFGLPIGWDCKNPLALPECVQLSASPSTWILTSPTKWGMWLPKIVGWLLTAAAISLGAPFWFDILNKFMIVRSTVKPREKSPEEKPVG